MNSFDYTGENASINTYFSLHKQQGLEQTLINDKEFCTVFQKSILIAQTPISLKVLTSGFLWLKDTKSEFI